MKRIALFCALFAVMCCSKKEPSSERIIARVKDREITEREFLERAEYTIRPPYAKMDYYIHKKIILNSLIAEALLAREPAAEELLNNERFRLFLQGQKEQAMRQMFYRRYFYEPIKLDSQEVSKVFDLAGRTYEVQYISTRNAALNNLIEERVKRQHLPFDETVRQFTGLDSLPIRKVSFDMQEVDQVRRALFEQPIKVGEVVGPIRIDHEFLWLKVLGWRERPPADTQDMQNRSRDVTEHLTFKYAEQAFQQYVGKLMKGKRVEFDSQSFVELVNLLGPLYFPPREEKEAEIKRLVWNRLDGNDLPIDSLSVRLETLKDRPLFTYDGRTWTFGDLDRELLLHPLHFRKKRMAKNEFAEQLKLALVDILRDKEITRRAYQKGFDRHPYVIRRTAMWRDAYAAEAVRNAYLASIGKLEAFPNAYLQIIEKDLNPIVDELQHKYSNDIEINTDHLENLALTRTDMFAVYADQPYAMIVPPFPLLTTDHQLDYGRKTSGGR